MITEDQVTFRLRFVRRFDTDVQAFVGYVPNLQLYAQSPTETGLRIALRATAMRFILACADKEIFGRIMQSSGAKELTDAEANAILHSEHGEFVSIDGYQESCDPIEVTVPFSAFATHAAAV